MVWVWARVKVWVITGCPAGAPFAGTVAAPGFDGDVAAWREAEHDHNVAQASMQMIFLIVEIYAPS